MTARKIENTNYKLGDLLRNYRKRLSDLPSSRQQFIENRSLVYFNNEEWISEKTLANYETGKNIPSLENLKKLAIALEVDPLELFKDILDVI